MTRGRRDGDVDRDRGDEGSVRALMLGYCRGEPEAFERLYSRVAPAIFAELAARTGDRQRAEALLDRTFQVLHGLRSSYVEGADPYPWILQMARKEFVVDCRRHSQEARRPLWSRVRAVFARTAQVELEASS